MTHAAFIRKLPVMAFLVLITFATLVATPAWSQESSPPSAEGGNASSAGMQVAAGLLTIPYVACKAAFAIAGGIVGGLTYVFTGGNEGAAKSVWTTSMYGTYVITPEHLQGDKAIRFLGVADQGTSGQVYEPVPEPAR